MNKLIKLSLLALIVIPNLSWAGSVSESEISQQLSWLNSEIENHDHESEAMKFVFQKIQTSLDKLDSKIVYEKPNQIIDMDLFVMADDITTSYAGLDLEPQVALAVYRNIWLARHHLQNNRIEPFDVPVVSEDIMITADFVDNQLWNLEDLLSRSPAQFNGN